MSILDPLSLDLDRFRLGTLCKNNHNWQDTGLTLRYISSSQCVQCLRVKASIHQKTRRARETAVRLKKGSPPGGRSGGEPHRILTNRIRGRTILLLESRGWTDTICLVAGIGSSSRSPDVTFIHASSTFVVVEVGKFQPCKWGSSTSVIHVGFNHRISRVNFQGHAFEAVLYDAILEAVQGIDIVKQPKPTQESARIQVVASKPNILRDRAILALISSGLALSEISGLKIDNYDALQRTVTLKESEDAVFWLSFRPSNEIQEWLNIRKSLPVLTMAMFVSLDNVSYGHPLSSNAMSQISKSSRYALLSQIR